MKMDVNLKTSFSLLFIAGVSVAWRPIAHDRRCQVYSPAPASTKCGSYRYQYDRKTNLCQPTCFTAAPFSTFMECSENCRSIEVCFMHRPLSSCGSGIFPVYYFNAMKDACFVEQGCTYKGNNFPSLAECQRTCRPKTQGPSQIPLGVPGSGGSSHHNPTQSSTRGVPPFTQQTPQSTWSRPMAPQQNTHSWNGGMSPSNQQQGRPVQSGQGAVPPPWNNPTSSASSHQGPQQSWSSGVPPMQQSPGSVSPFPTQSGQQSWNGPAVSQPGAQQQWSNGISPFNTQQQQGAGTLPPYPQQPGQQSWSGQMASPNEPQSPHQQWNNGAQPMNNPNTVLQQSRAGTMPTSSQQQWSTLGSSGIPPQGTPPWGSGNLPTNSLQAQNAPMASSSSQTGNQSPWSNGVPVVAQPQSTAVQPANVAIPQLPNQLTQPQWNSNSLSGPWSSSLTSTIPQQSSQHQPSNGMSSPASPNFSQASSNSQTQQSVHQRVLSIKQQTTQHLFRRKMMSKIPGSVPAS